MTMRARWAIGVLLAVMVVPAWAERVVPRVVAERQEPTTCDETWTWASPRPQGNHLNDAAFSPTAGWVAVGLGGAIAVSADGQEWEPVPSGLPPEADLLAVTWGGGQFVAVGGRKVSPTDRLPVVVTSPDGRIWTRRDPVAAQYFDGSLRAVARSGSTLAAVDGMGYPWTSLDGVEWRKRETRVGGTYAFRPEDLIWTGQDFVVVGSGKVVPSPGGGIVLTSIDGWSWQVQFETRGNLYRAAGHGDTTVAVGDLGTARRVGAGVWTPGGEMPHGVYVRGVSWVGDRFVAIGTRSVLQVVLESPDGGAWQDVAVDEDLPTNPTNLTAGLGNPLPTFVAVGTQGQLATSTDGRAWERRGHSLGVTFSDVAWTGDRWVAVGFRGEILTSADGRVWERATSPTDKPLFAVAAGGGRTVAVGNGEAVTTSDGVSWSLHAVPWSYPRDVVWDGWRFLTVASDSAGGAILASTDGETWSRLDDGGLPYLSSLVLVDGTYLALEFHWSGGPWTSTDGVHWRQLILTTCQDARTPAGAWNGRTLVGVGVTYTGCDVGCCGCCTGGTLVTPDLSSWGCSSAVPELGDVAWDGRRFVAVGECGAIVTSSDGLVWKNERGLAGLDLAAVAASPEMVVVVGPDTILTRRTCPEPRPVRRRLTSPPR
jgi:hypothetical protein